MSTMSSATASGRDQAPSDKSNLKNWMCLFVLTRQDGTPFNATSKSEEDIMEICVWLGHTHPMGVLHYAAMELVALFCTTEDMQCATCRAVMAMVLPDEAITVRGMAPSEIHVKVYVRAVGGDPSKLQSLPSEEEGELHSPTDNPHPSGETLWHLQTEHGDLADHELCQLMEDFSTNALGIPTREQESYWRWPGGYFSERVRVGSPGTTTSISCPGMTRWQMDSSGTTSSTTISCSTQSRCGVPDQYSGIGIVLGYP